MSSVFPRKRSANVRPADAKRSLLKSPVSVWSPSEALAALLTSGTVTRDEALRSTMARASFLTRDDLARSAFAMGWISRRDLGALSHVAIVSTIESRLRALAGLAPVKASHFASLGVSDRDPAAATK